MGLTLAKKIIFKARFFYNSKFEIRSFFLIPRATPGTSASYFIYTDKMRIKFTGIHCLGGIKKIHWRNNEQGKV